MDADVFRVPRPGLVEGGLEVELPGGGEAVGDPVAGAGGVAQQGPRTREDGVDGALLRDAPQRLGQPTPELVEVGRRVPVLGQVLQLGLAGRCGEALTAARCPLVLAVEVLAAGGLVEGLGRGRYSVFFCGSSAASASRRSTWAWSTSWASTRSKG